MKENNDKKKKVLRIVACLVVVIGLGTILLIKNDVFLSQDQKAEKLKQNQITDINNKTLYPKLKELSFDELDAKIKSGDDFIAYFAWPYECGDSRNFELNSFDDYLKNENIRAKTYLINLDKLAPNALVNNDLRGPIAQRFLINTWTKDASLSPMELKAPQIIHYNNHKIVDLVSWTVPNNDSKYGILKNLTDSFFNKIK
ncbi:MAG: hypothetical protein LBT75_02625 [Bacilli bacterium]|jgi:hypothetical protein|nr:hypothetical protein [Bacilli bacterium]